MKPLCPLLCSRLASARSAIHPFLLSSGPAVKPLCPLALLAPSQRSLRNSPFPSFFRARGEAALPSALLAARQRSQYSRASRYHCSRPLAGSPDSRAHRQFTHAAIHPWRPFQGFAVKPILRRKACVPVRPAPIHPQLSSRAQSRDLRFAKQYPRSPARQQPRVAANRGPRQAVLAGVSGVPASCACWGEKRGPRQAVLAGVRSGVPGKLCLLG